MSTALLTAEWEGAPVDHWRQAWRIPELLVYSYAGSTNDIIRRAALGGRPAGTTAIADYQTGGRGRLGRSWVAPAGMALLLSVLFRPPSSPFSEAGTLPVRVGLALARVLCSTAGEIITLKWPNDLLAGKDKLAGILCEAAGDFLVVGIGVNVLQQAADFPPEIRGQATSLRLVTGSIGSRASLAGAILDELRMWFERASGPLTPAELERFAALDALAGSQVVIDGKQPGVARGIDRSGALLLETAGRLRTVHAGTVRKAP